MAAITSVVTFDKPLKHLSLNDWNVRINQLRNNAETKRVDAFTFRQLSRNLRNESTVESFWSTYYNNERFSDRVAELDRWRQTLIECYNRIDKEIKTLQHEKEVTEKSLESQITPLIVVSECISQRDVRLPTELTLDSVDEELHRELCIVESNQRLLRDQCQAGKSILYTRERIVSAYKLYNVFFVVVFCCCYFCCYYVCGEES
jgi:tektin-2